VPRGIDLNEVVFVDSAVPQMKLGCGVLEYSVSVNSVKKSKPGLPSSSGQVVPKASASPEAKKPAEERTLKREHSVTEEAAAEEIAKTTRTAFENNLLCSDDSRNNTTVEFWLQGMIAHIDGQKRRWVGDSAGFVGSLDGWSSQYFRFVCTRLLGVTDLGAAFCLMALCLVCVLVSSTALFAGKSFGPVPNFLGVDPRDRPRGPPGSS
jgi:hypothetical protein